MIKEIKGFKIGGIVSFNADRKYYGVIYKLLPALIPEQIDSCIVEGEPFKMGIIGIDKLTLEKSYPEQLSEELTKKKPLKDLEFVVLEEE